MSEPFRDSVQTAPALGPMRKTHGRRSSIAVVLASLVLLTACSADPPAETAAIVTPATTTEQIGEATNLFPDLDVVSVATGDSLNLKEELSGGELPVLLWFWAPH